MIDFQENSQVEYYNDTQELLLEDDIPETDIHVIGWKKKFRIRGLTFGQMETINKNSIDTETGNLKSDEFVYWTIVEGVVRPKFNIIQARQLASKNGEFVRELSDHIWRFSKFSKHIFETYLKTQEEVAQVDANEENKKTK